MADTSGEKVWIRADLQVSKNPVKDLLNNIRTVYGEEEGQRKINHIIEHMKKILNRTASHDEGLNNGHD